MQCSAVAALAWHAEALGSISSTRVPWYFLCLTTNSLFQRFTGTIPANTAILQKFKRLCQCNTEFESLHKTQVLLPAISVGWFLSFLLFCFCYARENIESRHLKHYQHNNYYRLTLKILLKIATVMMSTIIAVTSFERDKNYVAKDKTLKYINITMWYSNKLITI